MSALMDDGPDALCFERLISSYAANSPKMPITGCVLKNKLSAKTATIMFPYIVSMCSANIDGVEMSNII